MKTHQCNLCGTKFGTFNELKSHKVLRKCIPSHQCGQCSQVFRSKTNLAHHENEHHINQRTCPFCEQTFDRQHLLTHVKENHPKSKDPQDVQRIRFTPSTARFKNTVFTYNARLPMLMPADALHFVLFLSLKQLFLELKAHCLKFSVVLSGIFSRSGGNLSNEITTIPIRLRSLYFFPQKTDKLFKNQIDYLSNEAKKRIEILHDIPGSSFTFHGFDNMSVEIANLPSLTTLPPPKKKKYH